MPATWALSIPSGVPKEDNVVSYFLDKILKCDENMDKNMGENTDKNTDGTMDIGDYVNSILDSGPRKSGALFPSFNHLFSQLLLFLKKNFITFSKPSLNVKN